MVEDSGLWDVICDGPYVPTKKVGDPLETMLKTIKEYNDADRKDVEKNFPAKKILVCAKRNLVPDKCFKRMNATNNVVKQALAAWGDSSSESKGETDAEDKDALTLELGEAEQTRDDLVVCVVDLKETIDHLENEKKVLTERITSVEHERDDLVVVVVDLKETIENLSKEKDALMERVTAVEQERDNFLIVIVDLRETIEELGAECRPGNSDKMKEVASEAHFKLENELNVVRTSLCAELEKNRQLQAELDRVLNNGKDHLGKFNAKSDEGIFLGYSSRSKTYKVYNKTTQCVEESVHVIFDESYPSCERSNKGDQDGEPLSVPGEVIDMANGKTDLMSQVKIMKFLQLEMNQVPQSQQLKLKKEWLMQFKVLHRLLRGERESTNQTYQLLYE
ncbi:PREDICTED: uncharacterized protein LOC109212343 [Nicotiana attenuata]|uniref:uncharacterized protein LOC109212343 n=1 Tax=Nicotiana attenuata TaxID=49451 RepID=UPI000904E72B|nr:PREDICTED: uncharacterized protein LOC109212343 [Nicotiana attenuata]